jgi:hypothetical protein
MAPWEELLLDTTNCRQQHSSNRPLPEKFG